MPAANAVASIEAVSPRLHFGVGSLVRLPAILAQDCGAVARVLLLVDPGVARSGERAADALRQAGHQVAVMTNVRSDPLAEDIDLAAAEARDFGAQAVVGLGGGSALDMAKLVAAMAPATDGVAGYCLGAQAFPDGALPMVLIPTTAGTGSEATRTAILTLASGAKVWAWGEGLRARAALLDPELTLTLPPALTAATGVDALVHAIEAFTSRRSHPLVGAPALQAIRLVRRALPRALAMPEDLKARGEMLLASWLAGQAIDLAGTGVAHALGHALGVLGHVHHGRAVGMSLRVALAGNAAAAPAAHAEVARAFGLEGGSETDLAGRLAPAFSAFLQEQGLDLALPPGLEASQLLEVALREENQPMLQANCRICTPEDLRALVYALQSEPL